MRYSLLLRNRNFYLMLVMDAFLVAAAMILSFLLRFDGTIPAQYHKLLVGHLPYLVPLKLSIFFACGLYHGMWRYTSLRDLGRVMLACLVASLAFLAVLTLFREAGGYPRSIFILDLGLTCALIGGLRIFVRLAMNRLHVNKCRLLVKANGLKHVGLLGAGRTGERMIREMLDNPALNMLPVALFDDDPLKWGKSVHGCPVIGQIELLPQHADAIDEVLIGMATITGERMRRIVALCEQTGKPFRTMPNLDEIMDGRISLKSIRNIRYEDLLGREVVQLDTDLLGHAYAGKRVLITGAGGSIGSELVRQMGVFQPSELGLLDFSEYNLFRVDLKTRQVFEDLPVRVFLADIRDRAALARVMGEFQPQVILHAAAYKHVPLQEVTPWEAILNNVQGTWNMVQAALDFGVERFVLVSTDKAVRPTNVMGATKRVAEKLVECANGHQACRFVAVRFGNVLGSSGSVVPIFKSQIEARLPITVTHPEVTRYFMCVSEAAQLILQAGAMAEGGEIFILDMGRPVRIADMARDLIRLHGLEPEKDVPIVYTGLRPGEKLYEELITEGEGIVQTGHRRIKVLRGVRCDLDDLERLMRDLVAAALHYDVQGIKSSLQVIVPEYKPGNDVEGCTLKPNVERGK
ncbi:NDP-sugar epimerase, includes UDP-GlcNAc-inverting 4,6-dehydratase FlaA1 and capsular polysaccharide biosynthesis protein EpsC [Desulfonatronum thiosulfatophilum]|uniref:NDP-sugar epimerase, includes UDP-GlcNAc-inverting 4,6-dehydratase FlaA1 and capsular polysaccharide biosynthesis protein EpsC n=1 Tax=Desulfonatronum thiosulfatophilum TaxID=617002 RepID=A0A1G6EA14_9BACT|nr:nucleoside-diphosphate sugar epimerase/dehydratase [Desulfonatronum thiosulfatophilum]SDB54309.1 NDP-sugar epimerase, includes UDP-GlcNAc-inverting 4,6-dehydratase FlaA1 and capsular polysaccharide biosynthesis protein EpsC [Desulfonatronum thiosulfatophilum]